MELVQFPSLPFFITFFLFFSLFLVKRRSSVKPHGPPLPPGPWKLPFIGNLHLLFRGLPHRTLRDLARVHGPLMLLRLGQVNTVVVSSREAVAEVMKHHDVNFADRPGLVFTKIVGYDGNTISLCPYGSYWKQQRKIYAMELLCNNRVKSFFSIRKEAILNMMKDFGTTPDQTPINLSERVMSMINTIVIRSAFGNRCKHQHRFLQIVKQVVNLLSSFAVEDLFPSLKFMDPLIGVMFKLERLHRQLDEIFDEILAQHQVADNANQAEPMVEDLVDVLLRLKDQGGLEFPITLTRIKAIMMDVFVAGTETSSAVIEWAMSEMIKNPEVMAKAQEEVREVLKGRTKIEESDTVELNYLKLVIKETLRLHPPGPLLFPRASKEACQILGCQIPAGTWVFINDWALSRDERYWDDPEKFKPERFAGSPVDFRGFNFEFLPFGAGRRICPGVAFGLASVDLALAHLLLYFDWKLPHGVKGEDLDMTEIFETSTPRKTALCLLASPRIPLPVE